MIPKLIIVIPCYNEQEMLPIAAKKLLEKLNELSEASKVSYNSEILFVNDGSKDDTWDIILSLAREDKHYKGISLSKNEGQQNALYAGLMYARGKCNVTITADCDLQDDLDAMYEMIDAYLGGNSVVYGVRSDRSSDSVFKRSTAQLYYKGLKAMGVKAMYNHADYRLLDEKALDILSEYKETDLFLRGLVPLIGLKSACVYYTRQKRAAGESHYPIKKMVSFAWTGITSLSTRPLKAITVLGVITILASVAGAIISAFVGSMPWLMTSIVCFVGGLLLSALGLVAEYIGKILLEVKGRPRYVISEETNKDFISRLK